MANILIGRLNSLMQVSAVLWSSRQTYVASYLQDVWKMSPRVTLTYGVRWEPFLPLAVGYGQGAKLNDGGSFQFSQDRFNRGIRSTVYPNAPVGLYFPGDPGFPKRGATNAKLHYFAPRAGLAWDVTGDGRTSVRASYGIAFDFSGAQTYGGASSAPPWGFNTTTNSGDFANPWATYPGGNPFPYVRLSRFPNFSDYYFVPDFNASSPQIHTWNVSIQRQLPASFLFSASYVGNQAIHTWVGGYTNRAIYFPGTAVNGICAAQGYVLQTTGTCSTTANTNQRRVLALQNPIDGQLYGNLFTREDVGTQHYHGMLLSLQRRASSGGTVGANYTWSHCIGIDPTANNTGRGGPGYLDPNDRSFDYGNCPYVDRRQIFNVTAVVPSPQFQRPVLRKLASGWPGASIVRASTGAFMTVVPGLDRALNGQPCSAATPTSAANGQRLNQIFGNPYGNRDSIDNYLNPKAFAQPAFGTLGNIRPFSIEGPGYWQLDMALARIFQLAESRKLELRAEAFNVTNRFIPKDPNLNLNANTFGQITTSGDARVMQFALKYSTDTSASAGGYLGTFVLSDLRKDFQDSLSRLHPADVTPILPLNGDYVLLQLLNEGEARWLEQMATGRRAFQQRQYGEAEHLFQAAIEQAERFGPKDARLGASLNALGVVYFDEKNYAAAEPLFKRALSIREESLGPEHPDVGATLNNLAEIYWSQKNYAAAGLLFTRALEIAEKTLGAEHPNVGDGLNNLAALYRDQGNYVAAEPLYKRSLAIAEKAFGPEHPNVGAALVNLAGLYHDERNYVAAEPSYKRALAIYEKALGPEHPSVRERIIDLAELYQDQGNSAAAEPLYRRA